MARSVKCQVWQTEISELEEWQKIVTEDKLIILEIYSGWFGYTSSFDMTIDSVMKELGEKSENVSWKRMDIVKIVDENTNKSTPELLEKYKDYCNPKPLFLFFKNKTLSGKLTQCNPVKLRSLVTKTFNGEICEDTLQDEEEPQQEEKPPENEEAPNEEPKKDENTAENAENTEKKEETNENNSENNDENKDETANDAEKPKEEAEPNENKPSDETKTEEPKTEEPKTEEPKTEEPKPEEAKTEEIKEEPKKDEEKPSETTENKDVKEEKVPEETKTETTEVAEAK